MLDCRAAFGGETGYGPHVHPRELPGVLVIPMLVAHLDLGDLRAVRGWLDLDIHMLGFPRG